MDQSDLPPDHASHQHFESAGLDEPTTGGIIRAKFSQPETRDLTVVQIQDTILVESGDNSNGADRFIDLMKDITIQKGPSVSPFAIKWLISDIGQLQHVLNETRIRKPGVFSLLKNCATVALVEPSSMTHGMLREFHTKNCQTITAFPSSEGDGYDFYENFVPYTGNRPRSRVLHVTDTRLSDLLSRLQSVHEKRSSGQNCAEIDGPANRDISLLSIEDLLALEETCGNILRAV